MLTTRGSPSSARRRQVISPQGVSLDTPMWRTLPSAISLSIVSSWLRSEAASRSAAGSYSYWPNIGTLRAGQWIW